MPDEFPVEERTEQGTAPEASPAVEPEDGNSKPERSEAGGFGGVLCHMTIPQAYRRLREQLSAVCGDFSDYEARRILEYFTGCGVRDFPWKLIENQPIDAGRRM